MFRIIFEKSFTNKYDFQQFNFVDCLECEYENDIRSVIGYDDDIFGIASGYFTI